MASLRIPAEKQKRAERAERKERKEKGEEEAEEGGAARRVVPRPEALEIIDFYEAHQAAIRRSAPRFFAPSVPRVAGESKVEQGFTVHQRAEISHLEVLRLAAGRQSARAPLPLFVLRCDPAYLGGNWLISSTEPTSNEEDFFTCSAAFWALGPATLAEVLPLTRGSCVYCPSVTVFRESSKRAPKPPLVAGAPHPDWFSAAVVCLPDTPNATLAQVAPNIRNLFEQFGHRDIVLCLDDWSRQVSAEKQAETAVSEVAALFRALREAHRPPTLWLSSSHHRAWTEEVQKHTADMLSEFPSH